MASLFKACGTPLNRLLSYSDLCILEFHMWLWFHSVQLQYQSLNNIKEDAYPCSDRIFIFFTQVNACTDITILYLCNFYYLFKHIPSHFLQGIFYFYLVGIWSIQWNIFTCFDRNLVLYSKLKPQIFVHNIFTISCFYNQHKFCTKKISLYQLHSMSF